MVEVATRCGADVSRVDADWGATVDPAQVAEALGAKAAKVVAIVHGETSTGVQQPLKGISELAHAHDALFLVDAVTTLGGVAVDVDAMGVDVVYSGTQKCLSAPPSLSPISLSPAAVACYGQRSRPVQSFYLDAGQIWRYWGPERGYHQTGMINMVYALREALLEVAEEGLEVRFARHRRNQHALISGLEAMGLELLVKDPAARLPALTTVMVPEGVDDKAARGALLADYGIEIGGGLGKFAGRAWRIGLMGYASQRSNVMLLLSALGDVLKNERVDQGLAAASGVYADWSSRSVG